MRAFDEMLHARFSNIACVLMHLVLRSGMCRFRCFANIARELLPGDTFRSWGGYANYSTVVKATGMYLSQTIIWVKLHSVLSCWANKHPLLTTKDFLEALDCAPVSAMGPFWNF
jgi:hypothetical protein